MSASSSHASMYSRTRASFRCTGAFPRGGSRPPWRASQIPHRAAKAFPLRRLGELGLALPQTLLLDPRLLSHRHRLLETLPLALCELIGGDSDDQDRSLDDLGVVRVDLERDDSRIDQAQHRDAEHRADDA